MSAIIKSPSSLRSPGDINVASTGGDILIATNSLQRLFVGNGGDVGIGTGTPVSLLTVEGILALREQASAPAVSADYGKVYVKTNNHLYFKDDLGVETDLLAAGGGGGGWSSAAGDVFLTTSSDNVGIGTSSPAYKLDVAGTINATAFYLNGVSLFSSGALFVDKEAVAGTINGINLVFTLASTPVLGSVHLYLNGILQREGAGYDYQITDDVITFNAGNAPTTNSWLLASYRK